jgi:PIN domain nuclease of toxin-antitoxin system
VKLLLDTNVFFRWLADAPLPGRIERMLRKPATEKFVSIVTAWEIVMKPRLNLRASDVEAGVAAMGAALLPVRFQHLEALSALPQLGDHRDPFDRMLIAQALAEDLSMVSSDRRFADYKNLRVIGE